MEERKKINTLLSYVLEQTILDNLEWKHEKSIFDDDESKSFCVHLDDKTKISFNLKAKDGILRDNSCFSIYNKDFESGFKVYSNTKLNDISKQIYPKFQHLFVKSDSVLDTIISEFKNNKANIRDSKIEGLLNKADEKKTVLGKFKFW